MDKQRKITDLSFEEALEELQQIVRNVETGKDSLEHVIGAYERGNLLRKHCEDKLKAAKLRVEKIIEKDSKISIEKLDI